MFKVKGLPREAIPEGRQRNVQSTSSATLSIHRLNSHRRYSGPRSSTSSTSLYRRF